MTTSEAAHFLSDPRWATVDVSTLVVPGSEPSLGTPTVSKPVSNSPISSPPPATVNSRFTEPVPERPTTQARLPDPPGLGSGKMYQRYNPTAVRVRPGGGPEVYALLDTGASLSLIDSHLATCIPGLQIRPNRVQIDGIGSTAAHSYAVIDVALVAVKDGTPCTLRFQHEFHLVDNLKPGMIIGVEWIDSHQVSIDLSRDVAVFRTGHTLQLFKLKGIPSSPNVSMLYSSWGSQRARVKEEKNAAARHGLFTAVVSASTAIEPSESAWVPCHYSGCRAPPDTALLVRPMMHGDESRDAYFAVQGCVVEARHQAVFVTNMGTCTIVVPARMPLTHVERYHGCSSPTGETFSLDPAAAGPDCTAGWFSAAAAPADAAPFDERDDDDYHSKLSKCDGASVKVDGHFNVGVNPADQTPPPAIVDLLRRHLPAFSLNGEPGHVDYEPMRLPVEKPELLSAEAPRRVSPEKRKIISDSVRELLRLDIIEPSKSKVAYPVLLVKQGPKWRFCVDYRGLNKATASDRYPLQRADNVFEALRGSCVFSALDAVKGYHQLDIHPDDRWLTAFTCHEGLFQYKRVPFGLKGAPAHFQRFMDLLLGNLRWKSALPYLDDVVVYSTNMEEHVKALDDLLTRATAIGLKFDPKKCHFAMSSLKLLGRRIDADGVSILEDRALAIRELAEPRNYAELHSALGLLGWYREFVARFANRARPLQEQLNRKYVKSNGPPRVEMPDGTTRKASDVEIRWGPEERAAFADLKKAVADSVQLAFARHDVPFLLYIDASKYAFAAALHQQSLTPVTTAADTADVETKQTRAMDLGLDDEARDKLKASQGDDPLWSPIIRRLQAKEPVAGYALVDGILVQVGDDVLCLPEDHVVQVCGAAHKGHPGFTRTLAAVKAQWYHPSLAAKVRAFVKHCPVCLKTKLPRRSGFMEDDPKTLDVPFHTISLDLLSLPRAESGHDCCLVLVDVFTKMVLFAPTTKGASATDVAEIVEDLTIRRGFKPSRIISDYEKKLIGKVGQALAKNMGAELTPSAPYNHKANPVERHIQTALVALRALCEEKQHQQWPRHLPALELYLNSTPSTVTSFSPFELLYVHRPSVLEALHGHYGVASLQERLVFSEEKISAAVRAARKAREEQRRRFNDRHLPLPTLAEGDLVLLRVSDHPLPSARIGHKLDPPLEGPFRVKKVLSPHRVELLLPPGAKWPALVDISQLKPVPADDQYERPGFGVDDGSQEWFRPVEIVAERLFRNRYKQYRVRWAGSSRLTWEFEDDLIEDGCEELISAWLDDLSTPPLADRPVAAPADEIRPLYDSATDALDRPIKRSRQVLVNGQPHRLTERPVAFSSKLTSPSESNYVGPELELSGMAWAYAKFAHYLEGARVVVVTDHAPLEGILRAKDHKISSPALNRARQRLLPHLENLTCVFRPGATHTNVDSLSRLRIDDEAYDATAARDL
ncbi:unnamed protein product [Parajaminaea phylloscopi]